MLGIGKLPLAPCPPSPHLGRRGSGGRRPRSLCPAPEPAPHRPALSSLLPQHGRALCPVSGARKRVPGAARAPPPHGLTRLRRPLLLPVLPHRHRGLPDLVHRPVEQLHHPLPAGGGQGRDQGESPALGLRSGPAVRLSSPKPEGFRHVRRQPPRRAGFPSGRADRATLAGPVAAQALPRATRPPNSGCSGGPGKPRKNCTER